MKKTAPKFSPIGDHIVVSLIPEDSEVKLESGLIIAIPETAQDKPNRGVVVAVGEGRILPNGTLRPIKLKVGQKVLFSKYAGSTFTLADERGIREEYLVVSYDDLLVTLK